MCSEAWVAAVERVAEMLREWADEYVSDGLKMRTWADALEIAADRIEKELNDG